MAKPTLERRQLGAELRRLRDAAGKQQREAAAAIECDISQISRVERGERAFKVLEIEALLDFYRAPQEIRSQITHLAQIARQRQPRRMYSDALPGAFRRLSDHEQDATEIYYSDNELIPGLLQTEEYIRALMRTGRKDVFTAGREDVEARVQFRLDRQKIIDYAEPPHMWFVIGEAALRRPVGGPAVMRKQLQHLKETSERHRHVTIQVVSLYAGDHPMLGAPIELIRFGGVAPDVLHQPTFIGGGVYVVDKHDIAEFVRAYDRLRAIALGPEETRAFIAERMGELDRDHSIRPTRLVQEQPQHAAEQQLR